MVDSITNFPNGISSFGVPIYGFPFPTQGNIWFVKPSTGLDGNDGKTPATAFKTLSYALSRATANQNDIVFFYAESNTSASTTDYQSTALDWNKDLVHLIGVGAPVQIGQRARIAQTSTVKTIENLFTASANGCIISNIEVYQGVASSTATSPVAVTISGQRNYFSNCQFSGIGDTSMDTSGARSVVISGSENTFENVYMGLNTVIRATAAAEVGMTGTPARNIFRNCYVNSYTSASGFLAVTVAAGLDRFAIFENCKFIASTNITSAVAPSAVFGGSTATINGAIHLVNPYTNYANYTAADSTHVLALGQNGLATGHLVGITQGIDVA